MTQKYLELQTHDREALKQFADLLGDHRPDIITDVISELEDAEELEGAFVTGDPADQLGLLIAEYLDALREGPDGAYLERRIQRVRESAGAGIAFSAFVVTFMALERVLLSRNRQLHTEAATVDAIRDALLRLNDIHMTATATAYLDGKEETIRAQQEAMLSLSVPVVEIWDGILALPLVGTIDTDRARRITQNLLRRLRETQARVVIIDISGVPLVDTSVANHLMKTTAAARLLGADGMIVGISPEIANTLVSLDIDFEGIETYYSLRQGLQAALPRIGTTLDGGGSRSTLESAVASAVSSAPHQVEL